MKQIKQKQPRTRVKQIAKLLLVLLLFVLISLISFLLLMKFDVLYINESGELSANKALFDSFKTTWYGCLLIIFLQIIITSLLSFVPGASMAFILLLQSLYDNPWFAFAMAFSGVMLSSCLMYLIGRFGGYNICKKLLGEEDCKKASDLLNHRGVLFFPIMMMFPIFPDDALVMVAGTLKMTLKWFIPSIIIGRGIGVATIIFGIHIISFEDFTVWNWVIFILLSALFIAGIFFLANKLSKYLESKDIKKDIQKEENNEASENDG